MNSKTGLTSVIIAGALLALLANIVALAAPFLHTPTFWVGYAFIWVALGIAIAANAYVVYSSRSAMSALYRTSISTVSILYLFAAVACSLLFMAIQGPAWLLLIVQAALAVACLLSLMGGEVGAQLVEQGDNATKSQTFHMNALRSQVSAISAAATNTPAQEALKHLSESLRYSDPVSSAAASDLETSLFESVNQLYAAVQSGDSQLAISLCNQMEITLAQRNAICRAAK